MPLAALTQTQIDKIIVDEGVVYINYDETDEALLGPVRGGSEFTATPTYRDIEFDGKRGKEKGLKIVEELNAMLKVVMLSHDQQQLAKLIPFIDVSLTPFDLTSGTVGAVASTKFLKNVTMICKTLDGKFKQVKLFNALNEAPLVIAAKPKSESELTLEFHAHWDPTDLTKELFEIKELATLV